MGGKLHGGILHFILMVEKLHPLSGETGPLIKVGVPTIYSNSVGRV